MSDALEGNGHYSDAAGVMLEEATQGLSPADMAADENSQGAGPSHETLEQRELKAILEAMLFVSQDSLTLERLVSALGEVDKADLKLALRRLEEDYEVQGRGLQLVEVAGGYRLVTRADYAPWVKRLEKVKPAPKLSRSALEALAIIAYKQPIVRAEIENIRGVETSGVLRTLLERKLIRMVGRKEIPGRPIMYGTTKFFLEHFGLRDLSELPPLREFKELGDPQQTDLPVGEESLVVGQNPSGPANSNGDLESTHGGGVALTRENEERSSSDVNENMLEEECEEDEFDDDEDDEDEDDENDDDVDVR